MVVSQIRSLYRDANDFFRTVIKRIYELWNENLKQWDLIKIEFLYEAPDYLLRSDNPTETVEERHGWMIGIDCDCKPCFKTRACGDHHATCHSENRGGNAR